MKSTMSSKLEIKPKIGLGTLLFGSTMQEVKNHLGEPEETETIEEEEGFETLVWHYWENGYSVFFDRTENNLFTCVEIDNDEATLWGERIFDKDEKEILQIFAGKGFQKYEAEVHEWGEKRITFDTLLVDLYFEADHLVSINFGALIDRNEIIFNAN